MISYTPILPRRRVFNVMYAGRMDYQAAWEWQRELVRQRSAGAIGDTLLLIEHPHTYTLGRSTKDGHLLITLEQLAEQEIALVESDRGGDITYHGPGQVVGYPILKLSQHGGDLLRYLRLLEETLIVALASYGVSAGRIAGLTGVWVGDAKIAAIGVKLSASGVTQHGFALNVDADLRYFQQIIPCGIADKGVTSMAQLLGSVPPRAEVEQRVAAAFGQVFGVDMCENEFSHCHAKPAEAG
ncbi:MAG: lipoyl(octanoyl) transferase LipB [Chloroflexota bacterium]|nr:lipoyl(octanoyl) transferase LipB [Chloroflexota bacterium]